MGETHEDKDEGPPAPPQRGGAPEVIPLLYDFIVWLSPKLSTYPKIHRFTLGDRTMTTLLEVLDGLIVARFDRTGRRGALRNVNLGLERMRYLVRLGRDLHCLNHREYETAARKLVEVGRRVGGWLRHEGRRG